MLPPESREVTGGQSAIQRELAEIGPMTGKQKRLLAISLALLCFWATEQILHQFDSATTTTVAVAILFLPGIGVMTWNEAQSRIPWGTVVLFGIGISLGTALLQTKAASWLANLIVSGFGLDQLGALAILAVLAMFLIVIHLGFASATALASSLVPIIISVLQKDPKLHVLVNLYRDRPYYFYGTYVVSRPWLAHHQSVAERFLTAIVRAHRFMYKNKTATVHTVAAATGFSQPVINQAYAVLLGQEGVFPVNEGLSASRITQTLQTMQKYKVLTGTAPAESTLVDAAPITAVIHKLGAWTGDPRWH